MSIAGPISIGIAAMLGFLLVIYATRGGAGLSLDSTRYLFAANNLTAALTGDATHRLVHYPPMFPLVLSVARLPGGTPLGFARWLNAILLAVNTLLAGWILLRVMGTRPTVWIAASTVALLALSRSIIGAYASVWSEPLYMTFLLLAVLTLHTYLVDDDHPLRMLVLFGALVSLACMTRYAGAALIPSGAIAIVWLNHTRRRWMHTAIFIAIAAALPALWAAYNHFTAGTATDRTIQYHRLSRFHLLGLQTTLTEWFIPRNSSDALAWCVRISAILLAVAALMGIVRYITHRRRLVDVQLTRQSTGAERDRASALLAGVLLVFTLVYSAFVIVSISLMDFRTPLDARILMPTFVTGLMLVALVARWVWLHPLKLLEARIAITLFGCVLLAGYATSAVGFVRASAENGLGWSRKKFNDPQLGELLETMPADAILYVNLAQPIIADRFAGAVERVPLHNGDPKKDPEFRLAMRALREQIEDGAAWILWFSHRPKPSELSHAELREALMLQIRGRGEGWILYSRNRRRIQEANAAARAARNAGRPTTTSGPADVPDEPVPDLDRDLPDQTP